MRLRNFVWSLWAGIAYSSIIDRQLLDYAPIPTDAYTPSLGPDTVTLLDFIKSRPELSSLKDILEQTAGEIHKI